MPGSIIENEASGAAKQMALAYTLVSISEQAMQQGENDL